MKTDIIFTIILVLSIGMLLRSVSKKNKLVPGDKNYKNHLELDDNSDTKTV